MTDQGKGRIFSSGDANTLFVSIPADIAVDSAFPFEEGQDIEIQIKDDTLVIEEDG